MCSWPRQLCPNAACNKRFYAVQDTVDPSISSKEEFFKFVNHTESGRITKEELTDWYVSNFSMSRNDAMSMLDSNWQHWDVPKNHSFLKLGWFRSKDQGNLDVDEFPPVQEFMKESLTRSLASSTPAPASVPSAPEPRGQKRPHLEAETLTEGVLRNVAQKKQVQSEELQHKLTNNADKGRGWFDHFDFDRSGELSKAELITALLQTFMGSHQMTRENITAIVDGIWDAIDTDGSGHVHFNEFQMLREALIAQLNHERVAKAVAGISSAAS